MITKTPLKKLNEFFQRNLELKIYGFTNLGDGVFPRSILHQHNFWQMNLGYSGSAIINTPEWTLELCQGDIAIFPPNCPHALQYGTQAYSGFSFKFELPGIPDDKSFQPEIVRETDETINVIYAVESLFEAFFPIELRKINRQFTVAMDLVYPQMLEDMLFNILRYYYFVKPAVRHEGELIFRLREEIGKFGGTPVTVSELAEKLGYSAGHLRNLVRKITGKSTKTIVDEERVSIAKYFLRYSNLSITQLSEHMKFSDMVYFSKFFRRIARVSPIAYRRQFR